MKNLFYFLLFLGLANAGLFQCKSKEKLEDEVFEETKPAKIDFDKASVQIMDTLSAQLLGRWNLQQVEFVLKPYNREGSVKKDTIFRDFAVLEIQNISRESPKYPGVTGQMVYKDQRWPVRFNLIADATRIIEKKGPHAYTLLDWNFPNGSRTWKPEELFMKNLGLIGDNYSIELDSDKSMVWKGLNLDVKEIRLKKM